MTQENITPNSEGGGHYWDFEPPSGGGTSGLEKKYFLRYSYFLFSTKTNILEIKSTASFFLYCNCPDRKVERVRSGVMNN